MRPSVVYAAALGAIAATALLAGAWAVGGRAEPAAPTTCPVVEVSGL